MKLSKIKERLVNTGERSMCMVELFDNYAKCSFIIDGKRKSVKYKSIEIDIEEDNYRPSDRCWYFQIEKTGNSVFSTTKYINMYDRREANET